MNHPDLFEIELTLSSAGSVVHVEWSWRGGQILRKLSSQAFSEIVDSADRARWALSGRGALENLETLGKLLGVNMVGLENSKRISDALRSSGRRFILIWLRDQTHSAVTVPWEALIRPGAEVPMIFDESVVTGCEFVRVLPPPNEPWCGRRSDLKVLATWCNYKQDPLRTEGEVVELQRRLHQRSSVRFRKLVDPKAEDIRGRLKLECLFFLYAGHGQLADARYSLHLRDGPCDLRSLADALRDSRAEVLIFNSCDSGLGNEDTGAPGIMQYLPLATCLIGMQGPTSDAVSRYFMPDLIERLVIGQPVWVCLHALRRVLHDLRSDQWPLIVSHLRVNYSPVDSFEPAREYLRDLID